MGTWGFKLYQDDDALDLKTLISVLLKLPKTPNELLEIAIESIEYEPSIETLEGQTFWLVIADIFEKNGIVCKKVFDTAISIINTGKNTELLLQHGLDDSLQSKRIKELGKLRERIENPRLNTKAANKKRLPSFMPTRGDVYSFPTMDGKGSNPWCKTWSEANFIPNGWGAMVVLSSGRLFDWYPWFVPVSLDIDSSTEPQWKDILNSRLIFIDDGAKQSRAASPKKNHFNRMKLNLMGQLEISRSKGDSYISTTFFGPKNAVLHEWSIGDQAINIQHPHIKGVKLKSLLLNYENSFLASLKSWLKK